MNNADKTILLVHPEISRTKYNFKGIIENECLELEYISALLKAQGYTVYMWDGQVEKMNFQDALVKYQPDAVYVCGRTRQENFMLEYCRDAKIRRKQTVTIIGGLHAQLSYRRMQKENVDFILTSFDIFNVLSMLHYAFNTAAVTLQSINGICYKTENGWVHQQAMPFDIKRLPLPDRTYFDSHTENYQYLELPHAAWVRTAYCCPYRCSFCHRNQMNCGQYVCRDIADVVEEIAHVQSDNIYICDDDFLYDKDRLTLFVKLVREKQIKKKYIVYGRTDFIAENEALMQELKDIGLYYVLAGLESIEDTALRSYHKMNDIDHNLKSIAICKKIGIHLMGMFIIGCDFTPKDFRRLYRWISEHDLRNTAVSIYTPEMGTADYLLHEERLITTNPSHWDYLHLTVKPEKMSVRRFYLHYYLLLIKLFLKAKKEGVYDFIDYTDYIRSFFENIFRAKRKNDDA